MSFLRFMPFLMFVVAGTCNSSQFLLLIFCAPSWSFKLDIKIFVTVGLLTLKILIKNAYGAILPAHTHQNFTNNLCLFDV